MLGNETVLTAVRTLPNSIQLLKSMAQILTRPEIKALFGTHARSSSFTILAISELTPAIKFVD